MLRISFHFVSGVLLSSCTCVSEAIALVKASNLPVLVMRCDLGEKLRRGTAQIPLANLRACILRKEHETVLESQVSREANGVPLRAVTNHYVYGNEEGSSGLLRSSPLGAYPWSSNASLQSSYWNLFPLQYGILVVPHKCALLMQLWIWT